MVTAAAGLLVLALLGQPARTYYWRDAGGQTHVTNTPPPPGAELLEPPPPPAVEPGRPQRIQPVRPADMPGGLHQVALNPAQKQAWEALDQHLTKARAASDRRTLEAVTDSLIHDCLWGGGLWAMPLVPLLALALMGLMGWWLALGLGPSLRLPVLGGFLLLGLAFAHLLLNVFLYHPQAVRLQQNLELLELHMGGRTPRAERHARLQARYQALEQAAEPTRAPWRFPGEVRALREAMQQVMVDP